MNPPCDCCSGPRILTPASTANRPGLGALRYRVGTWSSFFQTMQSRLSGHDHTELAGLTARDPSDPSIALLDAWALLADVLTFYQERLANEGYLRTATDRRSVGELARLVGYRLRPGVAASVFLAFTLDDGVAPLTIPAGLGAGSVPGPGEQMQTFETSDALEARPQWNLLKPRLTQPQTQDTITQSGLLYLKGTATLIKADDPILLEFGGGTTVFTHVTSVQPDPAKGWTIVALPSPKIGARSETADRGGLLAIPASVGGSGTKPTALTAILQGLELPPSTPPPSPQRLARNTTVSFAPGGDAFPRLLTAVEPRLRQGLYNALGNLPAADVPVHAYTFRVNAAPFGHNAPLRLVGVTNNVPNFDEWRITDPLNTGGEEGDSGGGAAIGELILTGAAAVDELPGYHRPGTVLLDNDYDIAPDSRVVIEKAGSAAPIVVDQPASIFHRSLAAYGLTGKTVQISLPVGMSWIRDPSYDHGEPFSTIRSTRVFAGSEDLPLAEVPVTEGLTGNTIYLDGVYRDLEPGRWLVVSGERTDVADAAGKAVPGIEGSELTMLANVEQALPSGKPGENARTVISLASDLKYAYKTDTVRIYGNVVNATHGQTRKEVLGAGDASQALQHFNLKQPPLTYVSAPTPEGIVSTLKVRVNELLWHEASGLADLGPSDRKYILSTDSDAGATIIFGNGIRGARLPTGQNNVQATYRNGIGEAGNVKATQISLLTTKPLGVKEVVNPIRASGGADREDLEAGRRNAPLAVAALDRLVSVQDYANFSRTFAGVGKAAAVHLAGRRQLVHVTIAGVADIPIDTNSDLYRNLNDSLGRFGNPHLDVALSIRERLVLVISARLKILPDYLWEAVEKEARKALLATFGFDHVEMARDLLLSDAVVVAQNVAGVDSVEVDVFDTLSEAQLVVGLSATDAQKLAVSDRVVVRSARVGFQDDVLPAQIAYLSADVPATLILQEWKS